MRSTDIAERAASYGMPGVIVDGMDALAVREATIEAVDRAKRGEGPTFIEAKTYRYFDHQGIKGMRIPYRDPARGGGVEGRVTRSRSSRPSASSAAWPRPRSSRPSGRRRRPRSRTASSSPRTSPDPDPADILDDVYTV